MVFEFILTVLKMKNKSLDFYLIFLLLIFCPVSTFSQSEIKRKLEITNYPGSKQKLFDSVVKNLHSSEFFIISLDRESFLIQCKIVNLNTNKLGKSLGYTVFYNLLIEESSENEYLISVQVNPISITLNNTAYFPVDLGVSSKFQFFEPIINFLDKRYGTGTL